MKNETRKTKRTTAKAKSPNSSTPKTCRGTGRKRAVLTKVNEEMYNCLKSLQKKLGYNSIYSLVEGLICLQLRCIRDYPDFHGGKELEKFEDLEDMLEMYLKNRIPLDLS